MFNLWHDLALKFLENELFWIFTHRIK